jgi:hypothetical protein
MFAFQLLTTVAMKIINLLEYYSVYIRCYAAILRLMFISDLFLDNATVNTFPPQRLLLQGRKLGVVYTVRAEELKRRELGRLIQLSSAKEAEETLRESVEWFQLLQSKM